MSQQSTILVFAASNSTTSINKRLAVHAANVLKGELDASVVIDVLDLNDFEVPIYSPEREKEGGVPQLAQDFYARIGAADGLIISYAEHNGTYSAVFKNIFDWCSRISMKVFQDKPQVVLSSSPGKRGGAGVMAVALAAAPYFGGDVKGSLSIGPFSEHFDLEADRLVTPELASSLRDSLSALKAAL
ncbi:MAG: NAD(P)H-dependent FMN reductase, partial [Halioglobus sp.]